MFICSGCYKNNNLKNRKQTQNIVFSFKNVSLEKKQANLLNKDGPP